MKTKELIKRLLLADPDGEAEVCVGNVDIIDIDGPLPCYWDGQFVQVVISEGRGVAKVIPRTTGIKIKLTTMDVEEAFLDNPEAEFLQDSYNPQREEAWLKDVEKYREAGRNLQKELNELRDKFEAEAEKEK